jgi:hypothetical protein
LARAAGASALAENASQQRACLLSSSDSMAKWNPNIPLNFRTGVFCFLMGSVCSVPISFFPTRPLLIELPESILQLYPPLVISSFILLPIWSFFVVRCYKPLPVIGGITFILGNLVGLLFPAIST